MQVLDIPLWRVYTSTEIVFRDIRNEYLEKENLKVTPVHISLRIQSKFCH